jgi:hypothetical protein
MPPPLQTIHAPLPHFLLHFLPRTLPSVLQKRHINSSVNTAGWIFIILAAVLVLLTVLVVGVWWDRRKKSRGGFRSSGYRLEGGREVWGINVDEEVEGEGEDEKGGRFLGGMLV